MAYEKYVLCRRDLGEIGATASYCAKVITKPNPLSWCGDCAKRLPIWPMGAA